MSGKVVLVTGGSRGIGKATIVEFAKRGYNVVINYHNKAEAAFALKRQLETEYRVKALTVGADVRSEVEVKRMIAEVVGEFGKIDVVVNNAGIVDNDAAKQGFKLLSMIGILKTLP